MANAKILLTKDMNDEQGEVVSFEQAKQQILTLNQRVQELESRKQKVRNFFAAMRAILSEWRMEIGVSIIASLCVGALLLGFRDFQAELHDIARAKSVSWNQSQVTDRGVTIYGGTTTLTKAEWPGQSLVWAAGLGFAALAIAISVVAVGASVALSRIGRE